MTQTTIQERDWQTIIDALIMLRLADQKIFEQAYDAVMRLKDRS